MYVLEPNLIVFFLNTCLAVFLPGGEHVVSDIINTTFSSRVLDPCSLAQGTGFVAGVPVVAGCYSGGSLRPFAVMSS